VQPPRVHAKALHQERRSPSNGIAAMFFQLLQKVLMTEKRVRFAGGLEEIAEEGWIFAWH